MTIYAAVLRRLLASTLVLCFCFISAITAQADALTRPAIMSPLVVNDWPRYKANLAKAKNIGVVAVSTDIWWGLVEAEGDQQFDWSYYHQLSDEIIAAGLQWVPILSFHKCGGNVGDDCNIPLPTWLWETLAPQSHHQVQYKSELGNYSDEVVALWADDRVKRQYQEFIADFKAQFTNKAKHIVEINISAGPAGELRYPAYNAHDSWTYPGRGFLQSYSADAIDDFQRYIQEKYSSLQQLNSAWGSQLASWHDISPPADFGGANGFFDRQDYLTSRYGKDLIDWYNTALLNHGEFMLMLGHQQLDEAFHQIPLGIKIPGIHWLIGSPHLPRAAEVTTGLIRTSVDINASADVRGYGPLFERLRQINQQFGERPLVVHFTCLEMSNNNRAPEYSLPKDLVFWIGDGARTYGIALMGENALAGGITHDNGWNNIADALQYSSYQGLTVLRVNDLNSNQQLGFRRYQQLIQSQPEAKP